MKIKQEEDGEGGGRVSGQGEAEGFDSTLYPHFTICPVDKRKKNTPYQQTL